MHIHARRWLLAILAGCSALALAPLATGAQLPARPSTFADLSYPADALAARVTGAVVVRITTDAAGRIVEAIPLSGPTTLRPYVVANVKQWTLAPGARADVIVYRFEIEQGLCNDDSRSLFRLVKPNLAVITACSRRDGQQTFASGDASFVSTTSPVYPELAVNARITGVVVLELSFEANGAIAAVQPLNRPPFLTDAAVGLVKTWRVRTPAPAKTLLILEFAQDVVACRSKTETTWSWSSGDYLRILGCPPTVNIDAARRRPDSSHLRGV